MITTHHLVLVRTAARRGPVRRAMPACFLGRPVEVYRARYRTAAVADLPLAA